MKLSKHPRTPPGTAPGTLSFIGEKKMEQVQTNLIIYDKGHLGEHKIESLEQLQEYLKNKSKISWVNFYGLHDEEFYKKLTETFGLHPLTMEDVLNTRQRPKTEEFENELFVVLKMLRIPPGEDDFIFEQLSIVLKGHVLFTFQEQPGDVFEPLRERLRRSSGRIRKFGADYLLYAILDVIADNYILILDYLGDHIDHVEEKLLLSESTDDLLDEIKSLKVDLNNIRKAVRPAKELVTLIAKPDNPLIQKKIFPYYKDLIDLMTTASDTTENFREVLNDQLNIYESNITNRTNEIVKFLTIFSSLFIPLTFIAGIYGMNFVYIPELQYRYGYFVVWGVILVIAAFMLRYFKKKNWL